MTVLSFPGGKEIGSEFDVICFSHLRWDFVFQRPQHLMTRFGEKGRVFVIEEPMPHEGGSYIDVSNRGGGIHICTPRLSESDNPDEVMPKLVAKLVDDQLLSNYVAWFYTPMMLDWASELRPLATVYDCMDQLSGFRNAPPELVEREKQLFAEADVVFTGGRSLFEEKQKQHHNVHAFPSSI